LALLLDALFSAVALSHLSVDLLNGQRSVIFVFLSEPLGLSNSALGLVTTVYIVSAALMQPVFGYLSDRVGPRWVIAGGVLWMGAFYSIGLVTPGRMALVFLVLASLGSGAFHPAGTMQATLRGRRQFSGHETTATSYFFLFGQLGLFIGPLVGGFLLEDFGTRGLLLLTVLAVPVGLNAAWRLRSAEIQLPATPHNPAEAGARGGKFGLWLILALVLLTTFQSWTQQNMITFIPKFLSDLGQSPAVYGVVSSLFMGGSALGNVAGGMLADRYGKRRVAMAALALASVPLYLIYSVGWSPWLYVLVPLAGGLTGSTHSILVVIAQRIVPGRMGLASGLILGYMFSSGALGTLVSGYLGDLWGVGSVFPFSAGLVLAAALLTRALPKT
jgi:FSR family fosmidomycin resistance protein-like MFS transporter